MGRTRRHRCRTSAPCGPRYAALVVLSSSRCLGRSPDCRPRAHGYVSRPPLFASGPTIAASATIRVAAPRVADVAGRRGELVDQAGERRRLDRSRFRRSSRPRCAPAGALRASVAGLSVAGEVLVEPAALAGANRRVRARRCRVLDDRHVEQRRRAPHEEPAARPSVTLPLSVLFVNDAGAAVAGSAHRFPPLRRARRRRARSRRGWTRSASCERGARPSAQMPPPPTAGCRRPRCPMMVNRMPSTR